VNPLVSCICPTRNRPHFLAMAIDCFLRQTSPNRELIIVDDGCPDITHMIPSDNRIRYYRLSETRTIGAKRNVACSRADGEIICHWDDDDYSAPGRIADQVARLQESRAQLTGYHTLTFANDDLQRAWEYRGGQLYACGTSFCYWRESWISRPFIDVNKGEDNEFLQRASSLASVDGRDFIVARVHSGNTSHVYAQLTERQWTGEGVQMWKEVDYAALAGIGYRSSTMAVAA
jgi:glycosyltransferase involved in cell wall biosynthesis